MAILSAAFLPVTSGPNNTLALLLTVNGKGIKQESRTQIFLCFLPSALGMLDPSWEKREFDRGAFYQLSLICMADMPFSISTLQLSLSLDAHHSFLTLWCFKMEHSLYFRSFCSGVNLGLSHWVHRGVTAGGFGGWGTGDVDQEQRNGRVVGGRKWHACWGKLSKHWAPPPNPANQIYSVIFS